MTPVCDVCGRTVIMTATKYGQITICAAHPADCLQIGYARQRSRAEALGVVVLDFLSSHTDCAGYGECVCDEAWPLVGLSWGDVNGARRAHGAQAPTNVLSTQASAPEGGKP